MFNLISKIITLAIVVFPTQLMAQAEVIKSPQKIREFRVTLPEGTPDKNAVGLRNLIKGECSNCTIQESTASPIDTNNTPRIPTKKPKGDGIQDMVVEPIPLPPDPLPITGPRPCEAPKLRDKYGVCRG